MKRKTILSMPGACFWFVIAACVLGIVIGSFRDFDINVAMANKTDIVDEERRKAAESIKIGIKTEK